MDMENTIEEAKKFIEDQYHEVDCDLWHKFEDVAAMMVAYANQYSTPQEGRGRYVSDREIDAWILDRNYWEFADPLKEIIQWYRDQIFTSPPEMERECEEAKRYALSLATILRQKHYPDNTQWEPLPDLLGLLMQIDNMVAGLISPPRSVGDKKDEV